MKIMIVFCGNQIPVYLDTNTRQPKTEGKLAEVLQLKLMHSKRLVKKFLESLDSIEIEGSDAILYSKNGSDTLALSLF
jgi:hypothetical protein